MSAESQKLWLDIGKTIIAAGLLADSTGCALPMFTPDEKGTPVTSPTPDAFRLTVSNEDIIAGIEKAMTPGIDIPKSVSGKIQIEKQSVVECGKDVVCQPLFLDRELIDSFKKTDVGKYESINPGFTKLESQVREIYSNYQVKDVQYVVLSEKNQKTNETKTTEYVSVNLFNKSTGEFEDSRLVGLAENSTFKVLDKRLLIADKTNVPGMVMFGYTLDNGEFRAVVVGNQNTGEAYIAQSNGDLVKVAGFDFGRYFASIGSGEVSAENGTPMPIGSATPTLESLLTKTVEPTVTPQATVTPETTATKTESSIEYMTREEVQKNIDWFLSMKAEEIEKYVKNNGGLFGYGNPIKTYPVENNKDLRPISKLENRLGYMMSFTDETGGIAMHGYNALLLGFYNVTLSETGQPIVMAALGVQDGCGKALTISTIIGIPGEKNFSSYKLYPNEERRAPFVFPMGSGTGGYDQFIKSSGMDSVKKVVAVFLIDVPVEIPISGGIIGQTVFSQKNFLAAREVTTSLKESIKTNTCVNQLTVSKSFVNKELDRVMKSEDFKVPNLWKMVVQ